MLCGPTSSAVDRRIPPRVAREPMIMMASANRHLWSVQPLGHPIVRGGSREIRPVARKAYRREGQDCVANAHGRRPGLAAGTD